MGHPNRKALRARKKKAKKKEEMLARRSILDFLDLTPYNMVGLHNNSRFEIRYK